MSSLLERLRAWKDDRGMMANLRCALVDTKRYRAWPALNRIGVHVGDEVGTFLAGMYATHPEESQEGNFGDTCRELDERRRGGARDESKLSPTERRFQQILAATREELFDRVLRMVLMAKAEGIGINYSQLGTDLKSWSDRIRTEWAASFWAPAPVPIEEKKL